MAIAIHLIGISHPWLLRDAGQWLETAGGDGEGWEERWWKPQDDLWLKDGIVSLTHSWPGARAMKS